MDDKLRNRVAQALGRQPALEDKTLHASGARLAPDGSVGKPVEPGRIRFQMYCSVTGRPFVVVAEKLGNTLVLEGNVPPAPGGTGGTAPAMKSLGNFGITAEMGWCCPGCGTRANQTGSIAWVCSESCGSPLHCAGERPDGSQCCACGIVEKRTFTTVDTVPVRSVAPSPSPTTHLDRSAPSAGRLAAPSVSSLPPPSVGRLPYRKG